MSYRMGIRTAVKRILSKTRKASAIGFMHLEAIGSAYACPVCGNRVKVFAPLDEYYYANMARYASPYVASDFETLNVSSYSCPFCASSDRDRLCALYFTYRLNQLELGRTVAILDIAPSPPLRAFLLQYPQLRYRSADLHREGVDDRVDITDMRVYADKSFDVFICSHVLEHVADDQKALSEMFRVLRTGGWGILMVPICLKITRIDEDLSVTTDGERWRRFGQYDHVRMYSKQGFVDRVIAAGFKVSQLGVDFFGHPAFVRHGISLSSTLYIVETA